MYTLLPNQADYSILLFVQTVERRITNCDVVDLVVFLVNLMFVFVQRNYITGGHRQSFGFVTRPLFSVEGTAQHFPLSPHSGSIFSVIKPPLATVRAA